MKFQRNLPDAAAMPHGRGSLMLAVVQFTASYARSLVLLLCMTIVYAVYSYWQYPHGGSWVGLTYGSVGLVMVFILMYYGLRKRSYSAPLGKLEVWVRSHMALGTVVFFTILFHSGFRFSDPLAVTAFVLLIVVFLSGLAGAVLYANIPPKMASVESNLSAAEISAKINQVADSMSRLAAGKSGAFQAVCRGLIQTERPAPMAGWRILFAQYRRKHAARTNLKFHEADLTRVEHREQDDLTHLLELSRQMKELHDRLIRKQTYVNLMAVWLYLHVPVSMLMTLAILAHVVAAFYYW